jgi:hypothetical protein
LGIKLVMILPTNIAYGNTGHVKIRWDGEMAHATMARAIMAAVIMARFTMK